MCEKKLTMSGFFVCVFIKQCLPVAMAPTGSRTRPTTTSRRTPTASTVPWGVQRGRVHPTIGASPPLPWPTAPSTASPCPPSLHSSFSRPKTGDDAISHNLRECLKFSDDEEGQFEPDETKADKERRMMSESPINKVMPIPEYSALFVFSYDNS